MSMPSASIVIDNYNYEPFVGVAIESALSQTHRDLEVIVVDDGSTDGSRDAIAAYADRVRTVFKENGGQASAVNAGFAASSGDLVCFLDADDVLEPTAIEYAVAALRDPEVVHVHWPLWQLDAGGTRSGGIQPKGQLSEGDVVATTLECGPLSHVVSPMSGNAFTRRLLDRVLPMPEQEFRLCADSYLSALAPLYGHLARLEQPQGGYRLHGSGNFAGAQFRERMRRGLELIEQLSAVTAEHAQALGFEPDRPAWREQSWWHRVARAFEDVTALIGPAHVVLIDDDVLGLTWSCKRAHPITERDGIYWGPPSDGAHAVAELRRMREAGARFAVIVWSSFWWLDQYPELRTELAATGPALIDDERIKVFDLDRLERAG
jgi:hypothetical protein